MTEKKKVNPFYWLLNRAYVRDDKRVYTGEALLLACLMHSQGERGTDMADVQRIMKDHNAITK